MGFDFELLLVLATLLTGVVYAWDKLLRRRRVAAGGADAEDGQAGDSWWVDLSRSLFPVILIVLIIRAFVVEPFRIPSGSMLPTLLAGDFILVNKFAYGLRVPVLHERFLGSALPERGDVAVFRFPGDEGQDYIKRIIGVPGDRIRYDNKTLTVNGERLPQEVIGPFAENPEAEVRRELIGGDPHRMMVFPSAPDRGFTYDVPDGRYFVMGDNRDRSSDSRYWGTVPEDNLVGEAFLIWMSWDSGAFSVNWDRIGDSIR